MRPTQHASCNDVLKASQADGADLAVTRVAYVNNGHGTWSWWQPSDEEREAIAKGAKVCVAVMGRTHPPLSLGVDGVAWCQVTENNRRGG